MRIRTTVYFESELHRAVCLRARGTGVSVSALVNAALRWSLDEDAADLAAFSARAGEPNLDFETAVKVRRPRSVRRRP